jgi:hypothetical protein
LGCSAIFDIARDQFNLSTHHFSKSWSLKVVFVFFRYKNKIAGQSAPGWDTGCSKVVFISSQSDSIIATYPP